MCWFADFVTTKFVSSCYFKPTTYFGPCCGPSSSHKGIYSRKLYSLSHKMEDHGSTVVKVLCYKS